MEQNLDMKDKFVSKQQASTSDPEILSTDRSCDVLADNDRGIRSQDPVK